MPDSNQNVVYLYENLTIEPLTAQPAQSITFRVGETWAIRVTRDGIVSNPDVSVDDGAKAIFEALKPYIETLKQ